MPSDISGLLQEFFFGFLYPDLGVGATNHYFEGDGTHQRRCQSRTNGTGPAVRAQVSSRTARIQSTPALVATVEASFNCEKLRNPWHRSS